MPTIASEQILYPFGDRSSEIKNLICRNAISFFLDCRMKIRNSEWVRIVVHDSTFKKTPDSFNRGDIRGGGRPGENIVAHS